MSWSRLIGTHRHLFNNLADVETSGHDEGDVLSIDENGNPVWGPPASTGPTLPYGGTTGQALLKDSGTDGDASWHNLEDIATAETDDTLVLRPDGAGGVAWVAPAAGAAGVTAVRTYISFGVNMSGQSYTP